MEPETTMTDMLEQRPSWADWDKLSPVDRLWLTQDHSQPGGVERYQRDIEARRAALNQPPERRFQCEHVRPSGKRCVRRAIPNSTNCWRHSSALLQDELTQAVADARAGMVDAAEDAVATLVALMDAEDDSVRLRAAVAILDRLGLTVTQRFEGQVNHTVDQGSVERAIDDRITELITERNNKVFTSADEPGTLEAVATPVTRTEDEK